MNKLFLLPGAAAVLSALAVAAPAHAQAGGTLIIYGNDKCPANTICVRAPESDRYRIPQTLRSGPLAPSQQPWSTRARSVTSAGAAGTGSCSASGAGGWTGCWSKMMRDSKQEKAQNAAAVADSPVPK